MRIWFARARASILWFSDRCGAIDELAELEDVVPVAVVIRGESTRQPPPIKASERIHLHLDLRSSDVEPAGPWHDPVSAEFQRKFAGFLAFREGLSVCAGGSAQA